MFLVFLAVLVCGWGGIAELHPRNAQQREMFELWTVLISKGTLEFGV